MSVDLLEIVKFCLAVLIVSFTLGILAVVAVAVAATLTDAWQNRHENKNDS